VWPVAIVQRYGQWSADEDETLIELKRQGLNSRDIYESGRLDGRSVSAITSRTKALNSRTRQNLLLFASQHSEEFCSHEPLRTAGTASDDGNCRIPQSATPVYKFVLDRYSQMQELQADPGTKKKKCSGWSDCALHCHIARLSMGKRE
jgi:hypothetical protein